jgi:Tol biopolymer transport system component
MERPNSSALPLPPERLESWKEIASYLNRGVRTVQRWEREKGLPVRRLPGGDLARVHALKSELDAWWNGCGIHLVGEPDQDAASPGTRSVAAGPLEAAPGARPSRQLLWLGMAVVVLPAAGILVWLGTARSSGDLKPIPAISIGGWAIGPSFSPDGRRMVFQWRAPKEFSHQGSEDRCGLYLKQIGGGPPVRLTRSEEDWNPSWSTDDRHIAFLRGSGAATDVLLVPAIGGPERRIATLHSSRGARLSWTPDAKWLILSLRDSPTEPYAIWALSSETGERRRMLSPPSTVVQKDDDSQGDLVQGLSPEGQTVVFNRSLSIGVCELYALRLTPGLEPAGKPWRVTDRRYNRFYGAAWTDEKEIVYSANDGMPRLFRVPVSGGASPQRLAWAAPWAELPAVTRAQSRLAYTSVLRSANLWRFDLQTGESRMLIGSSYQQLIPQYSPDGRRIAFQSSRSGELEVWRCDADGENCQQLTFFRGPMCGAPRWSPDGRWLALDSRAEGRANIYVIRRWGAHSPRHRRRFAKPGAELVARWPLDLLRIGSVRTMADLEGARGGGASRAGDTENGWDGIRVGGREVCVCDDDRICRGSKPRGRSIPDAGWGWRRSAHRAEGVGGFQLQRDGERCLFHGGFADAAAVRPRHGKDQPGGHTGEERGLTKHNHLPG